MKAALAGDYEKAFKLLGQVGHWYQDELWHNWNCIEHQHPGLRDWIRKNNEVKALQAREKAGKLNPLEQAILRQREKALSEMVANAGNDLKDKKDAEKVTKDVVKEFEKKLHTAAGGGEKGNAAVEKAKSWKRK